MSPKTSLLAAGLTALGFSGFVAQGVAFPDGPPPPGQNVAKPPSPPRTVLLLSNGQVLTGPISEEPDAYVIRQGFNDLRKPRREVAGVFGSIEEAYRYKLTLLPDRDPDEQLKLARWCLTHRLTAQAKTHLQAVLALSPKHPEARAMLVSTEAAESRAARRDPEVVQSRAEVVQEEEPTRVSRADLRRGIRAMGGGDYPVIFDLPTSLAVKKTSEFVQFVHPVLQKSCAGCHNERSDSSFQLVQMRTRHDQTPDALRANLDAALRLVDPDNLAESKLLATSLVPHGDGPNKRPIFRGANDPSFRLLSAWVMSLRARRPPDIMGTPSNRAGGDAPSEGFATNRGVAQVPTPITPAPLGTPQAPPDFDEAIPTPPGQLIPDSAAGARPYAPPDTKFPVPYMVGGPKPELRPAKEVDGLEETPPSDVAALGLPNSASTVPDPAAVAAAAAAAKAEAQAPPKTNRKRTPLKLDPALLEGLMRNRNGAR